MNITLKQLAENAAVARGLTKAAGADLISTILTDIKTEVAAGNSVTATGFGTFTAGDRKATTRRNPRTGQTVEVAAKRAPKFTASKTFKDEVNE